MLVCQLTAYTIFGQYIHKADRAAQAFFLMQNNVKRFKQMALLVAMSFVFLITTLYAKDYVQDQVAKKCRNQALDQPAGPEFVEGAPCAEEYNLYQLFWEEIKASAEVVGESGMVAGPIGGAVASFMVSYFVTFMVIRLLTITTTFTISSSHHHHHPTTCWHHHRITITITITTSPPPLATLR